MTHVIEGRSNPMGTKKRRKRSETAQRIFTLLKNHPDLTTHEIMKALPELSPTSVQTAVSRMYLSGELGSRSKKPVPTVGGYTISYRAYHVKYNVRPSRNLKKQPKPVAAAQPAPVEAPKVVAPHPMANVMPIKPEPEGPVTPTAEREVLVLRHLSDIYKSLNLLAEQQESLIEVLKGTLADLSETKEALDRERQRRNWWDKIKGLFS
jgi:hypothetical protein